MTQSAALRPGARIRHYEVIRSLGEGGMGVVYVARDVRLEREVALKLLPAGIVDAERRMRFVREARAAAAVRHRSIAQIYDVDEDDGRAFIAMELVSGETLSDMARRGPLPPGRALAIVAEIAAGLARAHELGIVHRDLKPANVMLDRDGQVKILDFGLAKLRNEEPVAGQDSETMTALTNEGRIMGTPGYMAPEQARGEAVDARADLFSLGVILVELLTGRAAFPGRSAVDRIAATLKEQPIALDEIREQVPEDVFKLLVSLLAKDPSARPARASDVAAALAGEPAQTAPDLPRAPRAPRESRRTRWFVVAAVAAAALGAGGVVLRAHQATGKSDATTPTGESRLRALFADPATSVACLPWNVGGDASAPGIGVAAAASVCNAAALWLWAPDRAHAPARLLKLATHGSAGFPEDPFLTDAGKHALATAAARDAVVLAGEIKTEGASTQVVLTATARDAPPIRIELKRKAPALVVAQDALAALFDRIGVAPGRLPDPARDLYGIEDGRGLSRVVRDFSAIPGDTTTDCDALAALAPRFAAMVSGACGHPQRSSDGLPLWPSQVAQDIARSIPMRRAYWEIQLAVPDKSRDVSRERGRLLRDARKTVADPILRSDLATAEATAWYDAGEMDAARTAVDLALDAWPEGCDAASLSYALQSDRESAIRVATAWCPQQTNVWGWRSFLAKSREQALPMDELAYYLSNREPSYAFTLGRSLSELGQYERLRTLASFHLDRDKPADKIVGQFLLARYERGEGRLQAAYDRLRAAVGASDRFDLSTSWLVSDGTDLEKLLGRPGITDLAFERFFLSDPPRLGEDVSVEVVAEWLARARPVVARRALPVLRKLLERGALHHMPDSDKLLDGYARLLAGDARGALAIWRLRAGEKGAFIPTDAIVRAGETDLAVKQYRVLIERAPRYVTFHFANLAKLLAKRGDYAEARQLAQTFIDAFQRTDAKVPAVDEMKALIASMPSAR